MRSAVASSSPMPSIDVTIRGHGPLRAWLFAMAGLVFLMVVVGGRDTAYRIRPFDYRMEPDYGRHSAALRCRVARGV